MAIPPRTADTTWQPFLMTPPVPDYPSTHTVLGWAAAEVLIELLGDQVRYSANSLTLPGATRHFKGFSAAAEENGLSRIYAGIHFRHAVKDGRRQGRSIGRAVAEALNRSLSCRRRPDKPPHPSLTSRVETRSVRDVDEAMHKQPMLPVTKGLHFTIQSSLSILHFAS